MSSWLTDVRNVAIILASVTCIAILPSIWSLGRLLWEQLPDAKGTVQAYMIVAAGAAFVSLYVNLRFLRDVARSAHPPLITDVGRRLCWMAVLIALGNRIYFISSTSWNEVTGTALLATILVTVNDLSSGLFLFTLTLPEPNIAVPATTVLAKSSRLAYWLGLVVGAAYMMQILFVTAGYDGLQAAARGSQLPPLWETNLRSLGRGAVAMSIYVAPWAIFRGSKVTATDHPA
jgi:hypothetical protein